MKWLTTIAVAGLLTLASAQVIDYGDLEQYNSRVQNRPSLTGDSVWISGSENEGFDVVLSESTRSKVEQKLQACGDDSSKCVQGVFDALQAATLELDNEIERRHLGHAISRTFKNRAGAFLVFAEYLMTSWKLKHADEGAMFLPSKLASAAGQAASATSIILSAEGSAVATITKPPESAPSPTESGSVGFTKMSKDENGFKKGDLVATMDSELASRLNEFIAIEMSRNCADGKKFDAEHPDQENSSGTMGQAICVGERIIANSGKDATFGDIGMFRPDHISVNVKDSAEKEAKDALLLLKGFVLAYSPMMTMPDLAHIHDEVVQLSVYVLALAIDKVLFQHDIGPQNPVAADTWEMLDQSENKPPSTKTGCPDPTATPLYCGEEDKSERDCSMKTPEKYNVPQKIMGPICEDGEFPDCPCNGPSDVFSFVMNKDMMKTKLLFTDLFGDEEQQPQGEREVECSDEFSRVPLTYWVKLYPKFCEEVKRNNGHHFKKTYSHDEIKPQKRSYPISKRTPPPKPEDYYGLYFGFEWSGGDCDKSCEDVYNKLAQGDCGGSANWMRTSGHTSIRDCGKFSYDIGEAKAEVTCRKHPQDAPRGDRESNGGVSLDKAIQQFCNDKKFELIKTGDSVYQRYGITENGVPDRRSFWLRASVTCGEKANIFKDDCIKALTDGMEKCDAGKGYSNGLWASVGCMDYSIDLSSSTADDNPPWAERKTFPPPKELVAAGKNEAYSPVCYESDYRKIEDHNLTQAIDFWCRDGNEIQGTKVEVFFPWYNPDNPPGSDPPFYWPGHNHLNMRLVLTPTTIKTGAKSPYNGEDMAWCDNYDWKLGKNDCTYAIKRILQQCNNVPNRWKGGIYTYRCVEYRLYAKDIRGGPGKNNWG